MMKYINLVVPIVGTSLSVSNDFMKCTLGFNYIYLFYNLIERWRTHIPIVINKTKVLISCSWTCLQKTLYIVI